MLSAINASSVANTFGRPASTGLLETQLNRYQVQLADWCHCPDGKTPDGQRKIAEIQSKADALKVQIQQLEATRIDVYA